MEYAIYALFVLNLGAFALSLYAIRRVGHFLRALNGLDWEAVATITGDIGTVKKSIQRLNNRINGLENTDPTAMLRQVAELQQNVTHLPSNPQIVKGG